MSALHGDYVVTFMFVQVTVSNARPAACNGVYTKMKETCDNGDRDAYEHPSGARICFNETKKSWVLMMGTGQQTAAYSREVDDEDVIPPGGEWQSCRGHANCVVKVALS